MHKLGELVPQHVIKPYWSVRYKTMTKERIDWIAIGKHLQRTARDCKNTWHCLLITTTKQGPFTAKEDKLIIQRVAEYGDEKQRGPWTILQQELGRKREKISRRWFENLKARLTLASSMTKDPHQQLKIARSPGLRGQLRARWTSRMVRVHIIAYYCI